MKHRTMLFSDVHCKSSIATPLQTEIITEEWKANALFSYLSWNRNVSFDWIIILCNILKPPVWQHHLSKANEFNSLFHSINLVSLFLHWITDVVNNLQQKEIFYSSVIYLCLLVALWRIAWVYHPSLTLSVPPVFVDAAILKLHFDIGSLTTVEQIANYQEKGSSFQIRWIGDTIEPIPDIITNDMAEVDIIPLNIINTSCAASEIYIAVCQENR